MSDFDGWILVAWTETDRAGRTRFYGQQWANHSTDWLLAGARRNYAGAGRWWFQVPRSDRRILSPSRIAEAILRERGEWDESWQHARAADDSAEYHALGG